MKRRSNKFPRRAEKYMRRALDLARRGKGLTSPNPAVGAVLVKGERIIGGAWHRRSGEPHAEARVLSLAGAAARGATMYVTMEPCCTFGRTPPCTDAILRAGIRRVVIAVKDPNPRHCGRGISLLRRNGVRVALGLLSDEAARLNEDFTKYITRGIPFTTVKAATTLDGKIASASGDSRWVSGSVSRDRAHRLRWISDAVLVGRNTALRDDPLLTARPRGLEPRSPLRVILDSRATLPHNLKIFQPSHAAGTVVAVTDRAPRSRVEALEARGVQAIRCLSSRGRVSLKSLWRSLGRRGIMSVLVEGGGKTIASVLEAGLADKVAFFIAPKIIGGRAAPTAVGGKGIRKMGNALCLKHVFVERSGDDIVVEGYL